MPGNTNDFLVFAGAGGANVISQAQYAALAAESTGFSSGLAASAQANKVWRQASIMASMIGQFIADNANVNVVDDGTTASLEANFILALQAVNQIKLSSNLTLYVNPSTGADTNNGLGPTTAFRTVQAAANAGYALYNYNQNRLIIQLAAGTYTSPVLLSGMPVGCPVVQILGNAASPSSYQLNITNGNAIQAVNGCNLTLTGIQLAASGSSSSFTGLGYGVIAGQAQIGVQNCILASCATAQAVANNSGCIVLSNCTMQGTGSYGLVSQASALLWIVGTTLTWNTPTYGLANVYATQGGVINIVGTTCAGSAIGKRYNVDTFGMILTNGAGINLIPGTIAGTATAGQGIYQ